MIAYCFTMLALQPVMVFTSYCGAHVSRPNKAFSTCNLFVIFFLPSRYRLDQSQVPAHMSHGLTEKIFFIRESIQLLIATAGWLDIFP